MKLYFKTGACSLSPHIVLREVGLPVELIAVDLQTKKLADGSDFRAINPKGSVPALEIEPGEVLTEGTAIVQFIAEKAKNTEILPSAGTLARYRVQEWLNYVGTEVHKGFTPLFMPNTPEAYKEIAKNNLATRFDYLNAQLDGKQYLVEGKFTVADAYLFTTLTWCKYVNIDLAKWPALQQYVERVAQRPSVKAALEAESIQ